CSWPSPGFATADSRRPPAGSRRGTPTASSRRPYSGRCTPGVPRPGAASAVASSVLHDVVEQRAAAIRLARREQSIRESVADADRHPVERPVLVPHPGVAHREPGLGDADALSLGPCGKRFLLRTVGYARRLGPGDQLRARRPERGIARADPRRELVDRLARLDPRLERIPHRLPRRVRYLADQPCGLTLDIVVESGLEHVPRDAELGGDLRHCGLARRANQRLDDAPPGLERGAGQVACELAEECGRVDRRLLRRAQVFGCEAPDLLPVALELRGDGRAPGRLLRLRRGVEAVPGDVLLLLGEV